MFAESRLFLSYDEVVDGDFIGKRDVELGPSIGLVYQVATPPQIQAKFKPQRSGAVAFDLGDARDIDVDVFESQRGYRDAENQKNRYG